MGAEFHSDGTFCSTFQQTPIQRSFIHGIELNFVAAQGRRRINMYV